jgi:aromatic-L-amino-acid/L-tryptophan decarboxylase
VCFRCARAHWSDPERATSTLLGRINASRRVFLSSTLVEGRMTIRVCILSVHTHRDRIDELLDIVRAACAKE